MHEKEKLISMILLPGEHIEYADDKLRFIVSETHTFGTDALLLAYFAAPKKSDSVCDFGTGCGVIPFYWLADGVYHVAAVEIQKDACEMLSRSITLNGISDRFTVYNEDIRELERAIPANSFSLITMNPPYTAIGRGIKSTAAAAGIARHEEMLTPEQLFASAARLLKFGGRMCVCFRPERLAEIITKMSNAGIEPKRLRFVCAAPGKRPWLFLLEGHRGRASGLITEKPFYLKNSDGSDSDEMLAVYKNYGKVR